MALFSCVRGMDSEKYFLSSKIQIDLNFRYFFESYVWQVKGAPDKLMYDDVAQGRCQTHQKLTVTKQITDEI